MKPRQLFFLLSATLLMEAVPAKAQKNFYANYSITTGNEWGDMVCFIPYMIASGKFGIPFPVIPLRFNSIKQNGKKWDYDGKKVFGFKGVDLFRDFDAKIKVGWQSVRTPVGIFAQFGYSHENFDTRASEDDVWLKHRINCIRPGLGIRVSPFENLMEHNGYCPIIEIGSTYDYYIGYNNGIDKSTDALNNGITLNVSLGLKLVNQAALMLSCEKQNYDLFNNDYKRHGNKPFEGVTTNHLRILLNATFPL